MEVVLLSRAQNLCHFKLNTNSDRGLLLGCDTVQWRGRIPTFRKAILPLFSGWSSTDRRTRTFYVEYLSFEGDRAIAEVARRRFLNSDTSVQFQVSPSGICGE